MAYTKTVDEIISVLVVTTSFPTRENSASGIFVKRLLVNIPGNIKLSVLTPCATSPDSFSQSDHYEVKCFRYAPWKWQTLAHLAGGIPAALQKHIVMKLLLPIFLLGLFVASIREIPKAHVVHANWSVNGVICILANFIFRRPLMITLRGTDFFKAESSVLYSNILNFAMKYSDIVTVVSNTMYKDLINKYPAYKSKVYFLPNGVDEELFKLPTPNHKTLNNIFTVLVVASLIKGKNIETIIKAVARIKDTQSCNLLIVGDGPEREFLKKLVNELELSSLTEFMGVIDPDKMNMIYKKADVLVVSSLSEGRTNVILEAFAAGVPVLASAIPSTQEMVTDHVNGILFQSGNIGSLSQKLSELMNNRELRQRVAEHGRQYILQHELLWGKTGQKYADLYKLLGKLN